MRYLPDGSKVKISVDPSGNRKVFVPRTKFDGIDGPPAPIERQGDIAWYVHYTAVHPLTAAGAPKDATWVNVSDHANAYYVSLLDIWEQGETFAVLEHDVICRPDVIGELEECPEPWCAYGYHDICHPECMEAWANALGCTRFREEVLEAVPDAMSSIPPEGWDWHNVCDGLGRNLREAGFTHHWHFPAVEHHHLVDGVHGPQNQWWTKE